MDDYIHMFASIAGSAVARPRISALVHKTTHAFVRRAMGGMG